MQGKGIIKFFLVLFAVVSAYQYMLIYPAGKVEQQAEKYAEEVRLRGTDLNEQDSLYREARIAYLDSMSSANVFRIPLFKSYSYEELKSQQLALGLDLKGGLSAWWRVVVKGLLEILSRIGNDGPCRQALTNAEDVLLKQGTDFITALGNEWSRRAN